MTQSLQATYLTIISCFPQMKPEAGQKPNRGEAELGETEGRAKIESGKEEFLALGVPEEWVDALKALGYETIAKIKELEKPGKLHQEMMGYRKKNKLEISTVAIEQISAWLDK